MTTTLGPLGRGPRVAAIGGGHGLSASLRALRRLTDNVTAVVGVADDGGSSGRLRSEFGIAPPGDLRMAMAAMCADDALGRAWSQVLQHRYSGDGALGGHAVGNLLIAALWEQAGDMVAGLDYLGALIGARGRVLPASTVPLDLVGTVQVAEHGADPVVVRGQAKVAASGGTVVDLELDPAGAPACPEAVAAIQQAEFVVLGPGSWFTSVLPHLELPDLCEAVCASSAARVLVLNLQAHTAETSTLSPEDHLLVARRRYPELRIEVVLADPRAVPDTRALEAAAAELGALVHYERLAAPAQADQLPRTTHNPDLLAAAFAAVMDRGRINPWR